MKFNLNEILEIARNVEKNGFEFYTNAAKKLPAYSDFFTFLAKEEIKHDLVFTGIKKEVISQEEIDAIWDPDQLIGTYFGSLTESAIFKKPEEIKNLFENTNSIEDVINWAIKREHDTILFFIGLKSTLDSEEDKKVVEDVISEEINHVHILMEKKSKLL